MFAADVRQGDLANSFILPAYARFDAMAAYTFDMSGHKAVAQVNVKNFFNTRWYKTVNTIDGLPRAGILVGEPITVVGSLNVTF